MFRSFLTPALAAVLALTSSAAFAQTGKSDQPTKPAESGSRFVPPANDNFANATVITAPGVQTLSSTVDATPEAGEPVVPAACATGDSNQSVWFKFTGGGTPITLDTDGSAVAPPGTPGQFTDTIMSVYTGSSLATLVQVGCNDDDPTNTIPGDFTSRINNQTTISGTTYYVRVSSFGTAGTATRFNGEVRLTVTGSLAPVTGPALAANPTTLSFGTATPVGTPSAAQTVTLTNGGTAATTITGITSSNAAFTVTSPAFPLTIAAGASATFTVRFTPTNTTAQTGNILVASNAPGSPLTIAVTGTGNADVTSTIPPGTTVGGPGFTRSTTVGTGASGGCVLSTTAISVPYRTRPFSVTVAGTYTITTQYPVGFDGYIFLYRTSFTPTDPCLNLIALDDDFSTGGNPGAQASQILNFALTAGQYVLVVTGFGNTSAGDFAGTVVGPGAASFSVAGEGTAANGRASLSAAPNPFQGTATVRFTSETAQDVTVAVYDVTGRQVATLFAGAVAADQEVAATLDGSQLPSGVYVIRATGTDVNLTQRVTVVR